MFWQLIMVSKEDHTVQISFGWRKQTTALTVMSDDVNDSWRDEIDGIQFYHHVFWQ